MNIYFMKKVIFHIRENHIKNHKREYFYTYMKQRTEK